MLVVEAVELAQLLLPVQRDIRGVDVEHQPAGRALVRGDELLDQHLVQRRALRARGPGLQPTQRGRAGQRLVSPQRRLHQHVLA